MSSKPAFMQKKTPAPQMTVDILTKLETLFEMKNWKIETNNKISLYNRYCNTLSKFDPNEQLFILELSKRFIKIEDYEYRPYFEELCFQIRTDYSDADLILAPCLPKSDIGKMKSARMTLYQMTVTPYKYDLGDCWIEKDDIANKSNLINDNTIIILVDDFVGTGETAIGAIDYVHEVLGQDFPNDRIKVLVIVVQQAGKKVLNDIGVQVYSKFEFSKGISDYYKDDSLIQALSKMKSIESKIKVEKRFHHGYGQSEALVCMARCPNNTFPVYWLGKKTAPYERR